MCMCMNMCAYGGMNVLCIYEFDVCVCVCNWWCLLLLLYLILIYFIKKKHKSEIHGMYSPFCRIT